MNLVKRVLDKCSAVNEQLKPARHSITEMRWKIELYWKGSDAVGGLLTGFHDEVLDYVKSYGITPGDRMISELDGDQTREVFEMLTGHINSDFYSR